MRPRASTTRRARSRFAGSDELAAQIRQGVKPDVFASANTKLPAALLRRRPARASRSCSPATGSCSPSPQDSEIDSLDDLTADGVKLAIGSPSVPIGSYTREVLARLPPAPGEAILANVRSNEPDVKGIVGKLTQGAVDAGFVYVTDVAATGGALKAIELPRAAAAASPTAPPSSRAPSTPRRRRRSSTGCSTAPARDALRRRRASAPPP